MAHTDLQHDPFDPSFLDNPEALRGILQHLDRVQEELNQVNCELEHLRRKEHALRSGLGHLDQQLALAGKLQHDLLPRYLPTCQGLRIHRLYSPAQVVSGDNYIVSRVSDQQVVVNLADATGHGLAAALLSVFVNQVLKSHLLEKNGSAPRAPGAVLSRVNQALLDRELSDCQFATSVHAIYDERSRTVCWARGGMPYPVLVRARGDQTQLTTTGGLLGAFEEQEFQAGCVELAPGDLWIAYSDGLEALLLNTADDRRHANILETEWCRTLTAGSIDEHLDHIDHLLESTPDDTWPVDDITVLILEATA